MAKPKQVPSFAGCSTLMWSLQGGFQQKTQSSIDSGPVQQWVTSPTYASATRGKSCASTATKKILRRHFDEVLNQGQLHVIDEIYTSNYELDAPVRSDGSSQSHGVTRGTEQLKQRVTLFRTAFPDIHFTMDEMIGEGDSVVVRYTYRGTHRGTFAGVEPSGRSIAITGILIAHLTNGRIQDAWSAFDSAELMKQIGR